MISLWNKHRLPASFVLAFLTVWSIAGLIGPETGSVVMSNSFYSLICFCAFSFFFHRSFSWTEKGRLPFTLTAGFLLGLCIVLGTDMRVLGGISWSLPDIVKKLIQAWGLGFMISAMLLACIRYLPQAGKRITGCRLGARCEQSGWLKGRRLFFLAWAVIFLCWIPAFLAYYPGIFSYDVPRQVVQAVEHTYSTHHPLIHTLYLYGSMCLGHMITGAYAPGVAFYTLTQMAVLSACFAYFCHTAWRRGMPAVFRLLAIVFFALNPIIHLMSISATKDTLFAGFMLTTACCLWNLARDPQSFCLRKRNLVLLAVSAALMMLFRNNGLYAFLVMAVVLLVILRRYWKPVLITVAAAILLYQGANQALIRACDADPGSVAEMLSIPLQQIARTLLQNHEDVTEEDRNTFYEIVPAEDAAQYYDHLADQVKMNFNEEAFRENPGRYLKLWISLGLRHPGDYLNAFFATTLGYWYPDDIFHAYIYAAERHGYLMTQHMGEIINIGETIVVEKHSFLPWLEDLYEEMATWNQHQQVPVLSMFFSPGMHCWLLLLSLGLCLCQRKRLLPDLIVLALPFGLWLTLLLSPTVLMRYVFPITLFQPFMLYLWTGLTGHSQGNEE